MDKPENISKTGHWAKVKKTDLAQATEVLRISRFRMWKVKFASLLCTKAGVLSSGIEKQKSLLHLVLWVHLRLFYLSASCPSLQLAYR